MSGRIITAGHICLDITPVFVSEKIRTIEKVLVPGKLIEMKDVLVSTGGSVANTGLGLKILGADVKLIGKIGKDEFGDILLKKLKEYGAHEGMIVSEGESTSFSVVISPPGTDRIFLHNPGANDRFSSADLDIEEIKGASLFHFGYPTAMKEIYRDGGKELVKIFRQVKQAGVLTSLDTAAVDEVSKAAEEDWRGILERVLPHVDFFEPSVEELVFMLDRDKYCEWLVRADGQDLTQVLSVENDILPLARQVIDMGAKIVLLKCGAPGMLLKTADAESMGKIGERFVSWADLEWFEESYRPERILSGTGAGDTSIAAFLKAVLDGYSPVDCLQFATATGASCVAAYDALSGLLPFEKLKSKIEAGWEKQHLARK